MAINGYSSSIFLSNCFGVCRSCGWHFYLVFNLYNITVGFIKGKCCHAKMNVKVIYLCTYIYIYILFIPYLYVLKTLWLYVLYVRYILHQRIRTFEWTPRHLFNWHQRHVYIRPVIREGALNLSRWIVLELCDNHGRDCGDVVDGVPLGCMSEANTAKPDNLSSSDVETRTVTLSVWFRSTLCSWLWARSTK